MNNIEFFEFINNLDNSVVTLTDNPFFRTIDLKVLTKDVKEFDNITDWVNNKNMPNHLKKTVLKVLLNINLPENVRNELLALML
jgi:hypothetical protein